MATSNVRSGFALPAVLAVTGVVTLVFLVAITALASLTAEAGSARARVRFVERAMSAEALIAYLAATEPTTAKAITVGGLRIADEFDPGAQSTPLSIPIALDGSPYALNVNGPLLITLQDQAGMINLAGLDDQQMQRFSELAGLPATAAREVESLYRDYSDVDDLRLPNGGERADYGVDRPANRPLLRPSEWLSLRGLRSQVEPAKWRAIRGDVAVDHAQTSINVNTATARALQVLFGLSAQQAQATIRARSEVNFLSLMDFLAVSGAVVVDDGERLLTVPSGRIIYIIRDSRSPWTYRARLTLTPAGLEQPLWIDQTELTEAPRRAVADTSNAPQFPYAPD